MTSSSTSSSVFSSSFFSWRRPEVVFLALVLVLDAARASDYGLIYSTLATRDHPLQAIRRCVEDHVGRQRGVYVPQSEYFRHQHYYYFRALGRWAEEPKTPQELSRRLFDAVDETPVIMNRAAALPAPPEAGRLASASVGRLQGIESVADSVVWLPGRYAPCTSRAVAAGGVSIVGLGVRD